MAPIELVDQLVYSYLQRRQYAKSYAAFLEESTLVKYNVANEQGPRTVIESCPTLHGKNLEEIIEGFMRYAYPNVPWSFYEFAGKIREIANEYSTMCQRSCSITSFHQGATSSFQPFNVQPFTQSTQQNGNDRNIDITRTSSFHKDHYSVQPEQQQYAQQINHDSRMHSTGIISNHLEDASCSTEPDIYFCGISAQQSTTNNCSRRKQQHPACRGNLLAGFSQRLAEKIEETKCSSLVNGTVQIDSSDENVHSNASQLSNLAMDADIMDMVEDLVHYNPYQSIDELIQNDEALANFPDPGPSNLSESGSNDLIIPIVTPSKSLEVLNDSHAPSSSSALPLGNSSSNGPNYKEGSSAKSASATSSESNKLHKNSKPKSIKLPLDQRPALQNLVYHEATNVPPVSVSLPDYSVSSITGLFGDDDEEGQSASSSGRVTPVVAKHREDLAGSKSHNERNRNEKNKLKELSRGRTDNFGSGLRRERSPHKVRGHQNEMRDRRTVGTSLGSGRSRRMQNRPYRNESPEPRRRSGSNATSSVAMTREELRKRREDAMERSSADNRKRIEDANRQRREEEAERKHREDVKKRRQREDEILQNVEDQRKRNLQNQLENMDEEEKRELLIEKELARKKEQERIEKKRIRDEGKAQRQLSNFERRKHDVDTKKRYEEPRLETTSCRLTNSRKNSTDEDKRADKKSHSFAAGPKDDILSKIGREIESTWSPDQSQTSSVSAQKSILKTLASIPRIPKRSNANAIVDSPFSPTQIMSPITESGTSSPYDQFSRNSSSRGHYGVAIAKGIDTGASSGIVSMRKNVNLLAIYMESWKKPSEQPAKIERPAAATSFSNFLKSPVKSKESETSADAVTDLPASLNSSAQSHESGSTRPLVAANFSMLLYSPGKLGECQEETPSNISSTASNSESDTSAPPKKKHRIDMNRASEILNKIHMSNADGSLM